MPMVCFSLVFLTSSLSYLCLLRLSILIDLVLNLPHSNKNHAKTSDPRRLKYLNFYGTNRQTNFADVLPPSFGASCPMEPLLVYTESGQFSAVITWTVPFATDNSGIPPEVTSNFKDPPHRMVEGPHVVIYTATDESGNKKLCSITIKVVGKWFSGINKKRN